MSEILENNVCAEEVNNPVLEAEPQSTKDNEPVVDDQTDKTTEEKPVEYVEEIDTKNNEVDIKEQVKGLINFLKDYSSAKQGLKDDIDARKEYLLSNISKYDSEDYFQNESFKNLYSSVFNKLGTNLDTEKFINLVDSYVSSRIDSYSRKKIAEKENSDLTEKFEFQSGETKKNVDKKLRMQDIPDTELEKYIAKYI